MKQRVIQLFIRYRIILIVLVFGLLLGYGLLKLQLISNPQPNPDYVDSQTSSIQTDTIRVKESLREQIDALVDTPVDVEPDIVGRPDPFNP